MKKNKNFDTPKLPDDSSLDIKIIEHPFKFKSSKDKKLNATIVNAINAMGAFGEDAEKQYQKYVRELKNNEEITGILQAEYSDLNETQYLDRWSIVQLLSDLGNERSLAFFDSLVMEKLPKERSKDPHSHTTAGEEVMIRTTAIDGISKMAANGDKKAVNALLNYVKNENFSIKRAAVQAFMEVGGKNSLEVLRKNLPKDSLGLLEIKRMDVRKVPQAEGGLFINTKDRDDLPEIK